MRTKDSTRDFAEIEHLAVQAKDPVLRRELEASIANGQPPARIFRNAWDRLWMAFSVGR
jgi:hypothetical protein